MICRLVVVLLAIVYIVAEAGQDGDGMGGPCADRATNCNTNNRLCTVPVYQGLMREQCALTCGACTDGGSSSSSCKDSNTNCATWKQNGFCESAFYDESIKMQYCQLSCNIGCGGTPTDGGGNPPTDGGGNPVIPAI